VTRSSFEYQDTVRFEALKEDRGPYFVEYHVPNEGHPFAHVMLVFPTVATKDEAAGAMEAELERWARRYPVPIMASAFDNVDSVIDLAPTRTVNHAIGWVADTGQTVVHWRLLKNEEIPSPPFTKAMLFQTYPDVPYTVSTAEEKRKSSEKAIRQGQAIRAVVIVWFVAIPVTLTLVEFFNFKVGLIATIISVLAGVWKLASIMGWRKKSKRQEAKEAEELRMRHHHYYCERDPEGFDRLKVEVLNREFREAILKEAKELKHKK